VRLGGSVRDALRNLGNPNHVLHQFYPVNLNQSDEVRYWYDDECVFFSFRDSGLDPQVTGVSSTCGKWSVSDGFHVVASMSELSNRLGDYCPVTMNRHGDQNIHIFTKQGVWHQVTNRNSPVTQISVQLVMDSWNGLCMD
jgi:hypothetical protein